LLLRIIISCFLLVFSWYSGLAQSNRMVLLESYLPVLEKMHEVRFSFIDSDVKGVMIPTPSEKEGLQKKLGNLHAQTGLIFRFVSPGYIVIQGKEKPELIICGFVKDSTTNIPLPYVSVRTETGEKTQTDGEGYFILNTSGAATFYLSHLGYKTRPVITAGKKITACPVFFLEKQITTLKAATVTHFLTRGIQKRADNSYYIIPRRAGLLPGLTEPDVLQTLQQMPGILSIDQSVSNVSVRAGTHDQNLFLWNGIRLFQTGHFFGLISAFNPNLPHTITVYKNGSPAAYGESVSGTILIDSRPKAGQFQERSVGLNLINADFNTAFNTSSKTYWQLSGRRSLTDIAPSPTYRRYFDRMFQNTKVTNFFADQSLDYNSKEAFYFYDFSAQVNHQIGNRSSIRADFINIANSLDITQSSGTDSTAETSTLKQGSVAGDLAYERHWSRKQKSVLQAYISRYELRSEDFEIANDQVTSQSNEVLDKGVSLSHQIQQQQGYTIDLNYYLNAITIQNKDHLSVPDGKKESSESLTSHALAMQLNGQYKNLNLSAGIRQNYFATQRRFRTEPRLVVSYQWQNGWQLALAGETKSQAAFQETEQQQDFFGIEKRRWKLAAGKDIPLLTSQQLSAEIQFKKANWLITAEPFLKKVNHISSRSQGFQNQFETLDIAGNYTVQGLELLAQKQWRYITGWLNFHLNRSEYYFRDLSPAKFKNNYETPLALRSGVVYDDKKWQLAIGALWLTGRYYTEPVSRIPGIDDKGNLYINYSDPNGSQLEDLFQLNLSGSFVLPLGTRLRAKSGFSIQNCLNASTRINTTYRVNTRSEMIEEVNAYTLRRTLNVFARLYF